MDSQGSHQIFVFPRNIFLLPCLETQTKAMGLLEAGKNGAVLVDDFLGVIVYCLLLAPDHDEGFLDVRSIFSHLLPGLNAHWVVTVTLSLVDPRVILFKVKFDLRLVVRFRPRLSLDLGLVGDERQERCSPIGLLILH